MCCSCVTVTQVCCVSVCVHDIYFSDDQFLNVFVCVHNYSLSFVMSVN